VPHHYVEHLVGWRAACRREFAWAGCDKVGANLPSPPQARRRRSTSSSAFLAAKPPRAPGPAASLRSSKSGKRRIDAFPPLGSKRPKSLARDCYATLFSQPSGSAPPISPPRNCCCFPCEKKTGSIPVWVSSFPRQNPSYYHPYMYITHLHPKKRYIPGVSHVYMCRREQHILQQRRFSGV
jgi:hypothetical protein